MSLPYLSASPAFINYISLTKQSVKAHISAALEALKQFANMLISFCKSLSGRIFKCQANLPPQAGPLQEEGYLAALPEDLLRKIDLINRQTAPINTRFASLNEHLQALKWQEIQKHALTDHFLACFVKEAESSPSFSAKFGYVFRKLELVASSFKDGPAMLEKSRGSGAKIKYCCKIAFSSVLVQKSSIAAK